MILLSGIGDSARLYARTQATSAWKLFFKLIMMSLSLSGMPFTSSTSELTGCKRHQSLSFFLGPSFRLEGQSPDRMAPPIMDQLSTAAKELMTSIWDAKVDDVFLKNVCLPMHDAISLRMCRTHLLYQGVQPYLSLLSAILPVPIRQFYSVCNPWDVCTSSYPHFGP